MISQLRRLIAERRVDVAAAAVLGVAAAVLRLPALGPTSLFVDDAWVAYIDRIDIRYADDIGLTAVGFIAAMKIWLSAVGFSETAAQIPPLVIGVVACPLFFVALRRWLSFPVAFVLAGCLVVNEIHMTYSARVKQYSFDSLWGVACIATLAVVLHPTARSAALVGFFALSAAIFSFVTAIPTAGLFAALTFRAFRAHGRLPDRRDARALLGVVTPLAVSGLLMITWYVAVPASNITEGITLFWQDAFVQGDTLAAAIVDLGDRWSALVAVALSLDVDGLFADVIAAALLLGLPLIGRRYPIPTIAAVVPIGLAAGLAWFERSPLGAGRPDSHLLPAVLLWTGLLVHTIVIAGLEWRQAVAAKLTAAVGSPLRIAAATALVALVALVVEPPAAATYPSNDASVLVTLLDEERDPDDAVALHRSGNTYALYTRAASVPVSDNYHFIARFDDPLIFRLRWSTTAEDAHRTRLTAIADTTDTIWLLSSPIRNGSELGLFDQIIGDELGFVLDRRIEAQGAVLDRWVRRQSELTG